MLREAEGRQRRMSHLVTTHRGSALPDRARPALVTALLLFAVAATLTFWPYVAPLVLALWAAHLARPLFVRLRGWLHGRERAAGLLTGLFVLVVTAPIAIAIAALVPAGKSLLTQLRGASGGKGVLEALVSNGASGGGGQGVVAVAKEYGASASKVLLVLGNATVETILGAFVFFAVFHALLVEGPRWWGWCREHAPLGGATLDRLAEAFHQSGRGLIVGTGLTALVQGVLATILYAAFGVPRALLLGLLSVIGALIPMTGPMIVWVPVALGLAATGHVGKAIALAVLCAGVVGTIDNVLRPWLSRRFAIGLPTAIVLVAMLGGIVVFGGWGLLLGPLFVRLASETLEICREQRVFSAERSLS